MRIHGVSHPPLNFIILSVCTVFLSFAVLSYAWYSRLLQSSGVSLTHFGHKSHVLVEEHVSIRLPLKEQFMFYLPHSGMCNQFNEFANAVMVAYLTNRTLILPPLMMGLQEITWRPFNQLMASIRRAEEHFIDNVPVHSSPSTSTGMDRALMSLDKRFVDRKLNSVAMLSYDTVFDLSLLPAKTISVNDFLQIFQENIIPSHIAVVDNWNYQYRIADYIQNSAQYIVDNSHNNLAFIPDSIPTPIVNKQRFRYIEMENSQSLSRSGAVASQNTTRFKVYDTKQAEIVETFETNIQRIPLDRYHHLINLERLIERARDEDVLMFGSLFGSSRLYFSPPTDAEKQATLNDIRTSLVYKHPMLLKLMQSAVDQLSVETYVGVHLRVGDGSFKDRVGATVDRMAQFLSTLECPDNGNKNLEMSVYKNSESDKCYRGKLKVYVATDLRNAATSEILDPLRDIATVVTLDDLWNDFVRPQVKEMYANTPRKISFGQRDSVSRLLDVLYPQATPATSNRQIKKHEQSDDFFDDSGNLKPYWMPVLDQMIACRGLATLGTFGSTFSGYIEHLHKAFWKNESDEQEHGWILGKV